MESGTFEAQTRKLGIVILALFLSSPPLRIPKFPIPIPAPSAPCKHRIPKFPIPIPAPYRHALNAWVSPLATCALPKGVCYLLTYLLPIPAPSSPRQTQDSEIPNSGNCNSGPQRFLQTRYCKERTSAGGRNWNWEFRNPGFAKSAGGRNWNW